jgi:hypothetical protein
MKKCIGVFIGVFLMFLVAGSASAATYTDIYDFGSVLMTRGEKVTWLFDLNDNGFNPATQDVTSAKVSLYFTDDSSLDWYEYAKFDVGTNKVKWEVDDGSKSFTIDYLSSLSRLSDEGRLNGNLKATKGDFRFDRAVLSVEAAPVATPIPAAAWLLGSGLVGLVGVRRRFQK